MRFPPSSPSEAPADAPTEATAQLDVQTRLRILIEAAMEQAQTSDPALVARQLADELNQTDATLSDVRIAVQTLYQGDRPAAEAYLRYLAEQGFPDTTTTAQQETPTRSLAAQNQAIASYQPDAYGQIASGQIADPSSDLSHLFYSGNLIAELVANSAFSAIVFGERRSGTSAILRAVLYDQISKASNTLLDILDLHSGEWGGLEHIKLPDDSQLVSYLTLSRQADIAALAKKLAAVAAEVRRRQTIQRQQGLSLSAHAPPAPYLFLIDGLSEVQGALPGWRTDRRSKDPTVSQAASHLRIVLSHGPAVGVSCVATARDHSSSLCDATALGETRLLFLGRVSSGRNGGYRAIDSAIEDKALLPSPHDRTRYREALAIVKQLAQPVVFTPNGSPRLGQLADFSGYLSVDLLSHYQQALEMQTR